MYMYTVIRGRGEGGRKGRGEREGEEGKREEGGRGGREGAKGMKGKKRVSELEGEMEKEAFAFFYSQQRRVKWNRHRGSKG